MLRMPNRPVPPGVQRNLDRFRSTAGALELDSDSRTWRVAEYSWNEGPPFHVNLRAEEDGAWVAFVMDEACVWRFRAVPIREKVRPGNAAATPPDKPAQRWWYRLTQKRPAASKPTRPSPMAENVSSPVRAPMP